MPTNFLWYAGVSGQSGLTATAFNILSSDVSSGISNTTNIVSAANGTAGVFTSSYAAQSEWGVMFLTWGSSATTGPSAGGNITGWFLQSYDGGTTFESTVHASSMSNRRSPDFIIPHSTEPINSSDVYTSDGLVRLPPLPYKVMIQNNLGITAPSSSTNYSSLKIAPVAIQY